MSSKTKVITQVWVSPTWHLHELETGHRMNFNEVEIIDSTETRVKLAAKEALHILKLKPTLNRAVRS